MDAGALDIQRTGGKSGSLISSLHRGGTGKTEALSHRDSYEPQIRASKKTGTLYPLMTQKLLGSLDKMEQAVNSLSDDPTYEQVSTSEMRNVARWINVLSEAYGDSYDDKDLEKAQKPFHDLAWIIGQYKDAFLIETQVKALFPGGKLSRAIQSEVNATKQERTEEFHRFFNKFKHKKMAKALKILRNPDPVEESMAPSEIAREDRKKLIKQVDRLIDRIGKKGLFHDDPEELHDGRKSLRNLYAFIYITRDVMKFDKKDVDALFHLFTHYGEPQDTHIAQAWLEEKGFEKESHILLKRMREEQKSAMEEASAFLDSGVLEHMRETVRT